MNETPLPAIRVVIAEDSPTQSLRLQNTLEKNGFVVAAGANGRAALELVATHHPHLVVSDIQMPEMDGYELCRRIKADPATRNLPFVLLTSMSSPQDIILGLECGADNFVVKPYEENFLLSRLRGVLVSRELGASDTSGRAIAVEFAGQRYDIAAGRRQILNLLLTTYETAVNTNAELIKAHEELKSAQGQLIEAEKLQSVGRLAAGVAHEVRNPLAILEMGVGFLADQPVGEDGKVILGEMAEAVKRANDVITNLMDLNSGRELGLRTVDLHELIESALRALSDEFARDGIEIVRSLSTDLPPLDLRAARVEQLFINLFTNAQHAMPEGGRLTITSGRRVIGAGEVAFQAGQRAGADFHAGDSIIFIEVADNGPGVAPENLPKLFEPFFSTKPTGQGIGLGLTVARKIMDVHRGRIEIRAGTEGGTTVLLTFKAP
ncbi:MAG: response regulator [Chthoniobacteraceae bacterium]